MQFCNEILFSCYIFFYSAPSNVFVQGNLTVVAETLSNLTCSYDEFQPLGNLSIYYVGNVGTEIHKVA